MLFRINWNSWLKTQIWGLMTRQKQILNWLELFILTKIFCLSAMVLLKILSSVRVSWQAFLPGFFSSVFYHINGISQSASTIITWCQLFVYHHPRWIGWCFTFLFSWVIWYSSVQIPVSVQWVHAMFKGYFTPRVTETWCGLTDMMLIDMTTSRLW